MKSRTLIHGLLAVLLIAVSLSLSACGSKDTNSGDHVMMADHSSMPLMVRQAPQRVQEAYRFAAANPEILQQMPCYCGCGPIGHDSNYACFFRKDGALDTHGLGCGICVEIVHDVMRGLQQGVPLMQIRAQVDADYSRYGPPTDTPPVATR